MNTLPSATFAFSLPQGVGAVAVPVAGLAAWAPLAAGAASAGVPLLRAEVEPQARGLSVHAHAERVLAALQPQG